MTGSKKTIAVITCCLDDWGGSEELWSKSLHYLLESAISGATVYKNTINNQHPEYQRLIAKNVRTFALEPTNGTLKSILLRSMDGIYRLGDRFGLLEYQWNKPAHRLYVDLKRSRPDFVIISQGINFDGLVYAYQCLRLNIPYVIVCHKAVDFFWPQEGDRNYMRETLMKAKQCFFVSRHNLRITEEQFGIRLVNAEVIFNPSKTQINPLPYPDTEEGFKLACIGRLFLIDKGQDMLLRVLSQDKWKERSFTISFIGKGPDRTALIDLAKLLGVSKVSFDGFNGNLNSIWMEHHALILPSRSEGLPLTIIEAMSLGRTVIVTNAGGNKEILEEGQTGFVAEINEQALDEAMEKAWLRRDEWKLMGITAAEQMKKVLPIAPEESFAKRIACFMEIDIRKTSSKT